jgi:hypothetical protein
MRYEGGLNERGFDKFFKHGVGDFVILLVGVRFNF